MQVLIHHHTSIVKVADLRLPDVGRLMSMRRVCRHYLVSVPAACRLRGTALRHLATLRCGEEEMEDTLLADTETLSQCVDV